MVLVVVSKLVILATSLLFSVVVFSEVSVLQFHLIEAFTTSSQFLTLFPLTSKMRGIPTRYHNFRFLSTPWKTYNNNNNNNCNRQRSFAWTGSHSSVKRNMIPWEEYGLSFFARSLEMTGKRLGLPEPTTTSTNAAQNSNSTTIVYSNSTIVTSFELRVREAAAAELEAMSIQSHFSVQQHKYEVKATATTATTATTTTSTGYQRIEEWNEIQRAKAKNGTWEERVQFEGQKYGNQWNQNEILRRQLKF